MNFKKTWKRFMNMSRSREGFTLVELIVVIAILAILAGVAIPVYSGYITKANEAADQQLLGVLNTAFGAACLENNIPLATLNQSTATVTLTNGKVTAVTPAEVNDAFFTYFAGNENNAFKVIDNLYFANGVFVADEDVAVNYNGTTLYVPASAINALQNSTYGDIGTDSLLDQIAAVSGLANQSMFNTDSVLGQIVFDEAGNYSAALAKSLNMSVTELEEYLGTQADGGASFLANSLVLTTAQNTAGMTTAEVTSMLTNSSFVSNLGTKLANPAQAQDGLADAALAYGLYTSYVNARGTDEQKASLSNITDFTSLRSALSVMTETDENGYNDFQDYLAKEGKADVDAYLSAMEVISSTDQTPEALKQALTNGFADETLKQTIGDLIG